MDLQEQRLTCLRLALEMGCKADSVVAVASELMTFLTDGMVPSAAKSSPEERSEDAIAACGTALAASEAADLVIGQTEAGTIPAVVAVSTDPLPDSTSSPSEAHAAEPTSAAVAAGTEVAEPALTTTASVASTVGAASAEIVPAPELNRADQPSATRAEETSAPGEGQTAAAQTDVAAMANGAQGEAARAVPTAN